MTTKFGRELLYSIHGNMYMYMYYFIRIVPAATINFSLAWVWLLIEGSSYLRAAFVNFRPINKNHNTEDWFTKTALQVIEIRLSKKLPRYSRTKPALFSAMVLPQFCHSFAMSECVPLAIVTTPT